MGREVVDEMGLDFVLLWRLQENCPEGHRTLGIKGVSS